LVKGFVNAGNGGGRQRSLGLAPALNLNQVDGEPCPLLAIEVAPDGEMLRHIEMTVQRVIESAAGTIVIAIRAFSFIIAKFTP